MTRLLKNIVLFGLFCLAVYVVLVIAAGRLLPAAWKTNLYYTRPGTLFTYTRLKDIDTTKNADILILGTSHAYESYDTRIFLQHNWKAVNLGTTAQSFIQTELLVKQYINRLNPKFVLFDVYPAIFSNEGTESGLDLISNAKLNKQLVAMAFRLNNTKVYNTLIYAAYMQQFVLDKTYTEPQVNSEGTYIQGGYVTRYDTYKQNQPIEKDSYKIHADQLKAFENILCLLNSRKIPYVLTQAPMAPAKYLSATNNDDIDIMISKYGTYYNFNKISSIPINCFHDEHHLNQYGVNIFNTDLIKVLDTTLQKACGR